MKFEDAGALYDSVMWEGGTTEAILGYGIKSTDLPDDTPAEIVEAWAAIEAVEPLVDKIDLWLDKVGSEEPWSSQ